MSAANLSLLSPHVIDRVEAWRERFLNAAPFRHVVIDGFFAPERAEALLRAFPPFERGNYIGDDGKPGGKSTLDRIRALGPDYAALDETIRAPAFLDLVGRITGIPELLYDPFYLGGGTHENRHGAALDPHIDFNYHPSERWHRRLNLIVYLNPGWRAEWGGNLELFRDPYADRKPAVSVVPAFNRCVIFETTEHSWHGFDPIRLPEEERGRSRKSIALYFYSRERPVEQTAGRHTTHYVHRQLPERFEAGYTLDAGDVAELHSLLRQRDCYIRNQHEEIARLLQAQDRGFSGKLLYLAKRLYVRMRR
ncbi:2OG-Fe(II) oxygenase [Vulcaniibacterium tengchongense]|uniref:Rps23 Pro-64 3,4-dihydroxylase Tpa1-like proline 4-hydroxylase n=1 Tax=Vulcaniibacterium tengchongense TaxID=1273429 RepID=A0A3N4W3W2_9GAMM|nr:2OG-Fe(II) oxygenase [Vulcaniibacterium tengchongense]RPE79894.1 Rps23 Pro-64 3,4-dihydroxylase Tpa1-like proline 4-hydroxylase [Vulcaniibacterium tengchongense]